jgi:flagellar capping protein FliD
VALSNLLDPATGRMKFINDGLSASSADIQKQIDQQNKFISSQRDSLLSQFVAMEQAVGQLQSVGNFLTAQFSNLPKK